MAQEYLIFSNAAFTGYVLPKETLSFWDIPTVDENGDEISYTIQEAFAAASLGSAPPQPIKLTLGEGYIPNVSELETTHWVCPMNNITVAMDETLAPMAALEGTTYRQVKLKKPQLLHLKNAGEFPV